MYLRRISGNDISGDGDKSFQFNAVDKVQHSDYAGIGLRSLSYTGDVIKIVKCGDYASFCYYSTLSQINFLK